MIKWDVTYLLANDQTKTITIEFKESDGVNPMEDEHNELLSKVYTEGLKIGAVDVLWADYVWEDEDEDDYYDDEDEEEEEDE